MTLRGRSIRRGNSCSGRWKQIFNIRCIGTLSSLTILFTMIETCSTKRMLALVVVLLISSLIVLFFEEYIEDSELALPKQITGNDITESAFNPGKIDCPEAATVQIVEECQPCSAFEINALQSSHCVETGYYNKLFCGASNKTILNTCYARRMRSFARFNMFSGVMIAWSGMLYAFVSWRRKALEHRSYTQIQQFIG